MAPSSPSNVNSTISIPTNFTSHGNPHLLCIRPQWSDLVIFLFSNYFAHAATIISAPGQTWQETMEASIFALLVPMSGLARALGVIMWHAATEKDPIKRAARSAAFCMVARISKPKSEPKQGWWDQNVAEMQEGDFLHEINKTNAKVYGQYQLEKGYILMTVPRGAPVSILEGVRNSRATPYLLSSTYNIPKLLISLLQAIWALITLQRSRGEQLKTYGYAAFGLTVAQYAFMSIVNIAGNLLRPEYPLMFMIRAPLMDEAEKDGCFFSGDIRVSIGDDDDGQSLLDDEDATDVAELIFALILGFVPLAIVGGLTGFKKRQSTILERGFTISWLVTSMVIGPLVRFLHKSFLVLSSADYIVLRIGSFCCIVVLFGAPAIGGMVMVGRMIQNFGVCSLID